MASNHGGAEHEYTGNIVGSRFIALGSLEYAVCPVFCILGLFSCMYDGSKTQYTTRMIAFLKKHPFPVEAFFERSMVLTFAVPKEQLASFIPECLELDTFQDKWAFIAVAMVQTKHLRPKGFPAWLGNDFFLTGYRIFVRYNTNAGKRLRGLYILKSETDKKKMEWLGNLFTQYRYTYTDIEQLSEGNLRIIRSKKSQFEVVFEQADADIKLPEHSPFADWKEARRFAGPLPHTFSYIKSKKTVLIVEGVRQHWVPAPLRVKKVHFKWLESLQLKGVVLANAFEIKNIPYHWKKGRTEQWA